MRHTAQRAAIQAGKIEVIDATAPPSRRRPVGLAYLDVTQSGAKLPANLGRILKGYDGWAISASPLALRELLGRYGKRRGAEAIVCAWSAQQPASDLGGLRSSWEAVIVRSPRKPQAGIPDAMFGGFRGAHLERHSTFGVWVINLLGALPGDRLVDLSPDAGVARAWQELGGAAVEKVIPPRRRRRAPPPGGQNVTPTNGVEVPIESGSAEPPPVGSE